MPSQTVSTELGQPFNGADGLPNPSNSNTPPNATGGVFTYGLVYDDATGLWGRQRGNSGSVTALASAARTATSQASVSTNYSARGIHAKVDVTTVGTGQLRFRFLNGAQNSYYLGPWITTTGAKHYIIYPGVDGSVGRTGGAIGSGAQIQGSIDDTYNMVVTRVFAIGVDHSDASSWTYSLHYSFLV